MKKSIILILVAIIGLGISANGQAYSKALEKQANGGDSRAMVAVGDAYLQGNGTGKDLKKAEKWYKKAIDKDDNLVAYERMADLYRSWDGIENNAKKVRQWAEKGGLKGNPRLALEAASGFLNEKEEYKDLRTAEKLLYIAADSGSVEAAEKAMILGVSTNNPICAVNGMNRYIALGGDANSNENVGIVKDYIIRTGNTDTYEQILNTCLLWESKLIYNQQPSTINNARRGMYSDEFISQWKIYFPIIQQGDFKSMRDAAGAPTFVNALWLAQNGKKEEAEKEVEKLKLIGGLYPHNLSRIYMVYRKMGENDAIRFFDRLLSEDSEAAVTWLSDRDATKILTWDRSELKHKLKFKIERERSSFGRYSEMITELLPAAITQSEIKSMLNMAQR